MTELRIIYCRGGDPDAPMLASAAGMDYGVRYDYKAYSDDIYMLDAGLNPRWTTYIRKVQRFNPGFALTPDYTKPDETMLYLRIMDLSPYAERIGVCPKFRGAISQIPDDCIICESIPSRYSGWLIPDDELLPERDYHLLGGDPRLQKSEIERITSAGGRVISVDGNKLMFKAAHGQVFKGGKWVRASGLTGKLARCSAYELVEYLNGVGA